MQSKFGQYYFSNNNLIFLSNSDAYKYNNFIEKLNLIADDEQKWFDRQYLHVEQTIKQLDKLIK